MKKKLDLIFYLVVGVLGQEKFKNIETLVESILQDLYAKSIIVF